MTTKAPKPKVLAARVPDELYDRVSHLAWLTRRSMNDVLLSIIEPTIDLTYELLDSNFENLTATERVAAESQIDIKALREHTRYMEARKRQGRKAIPFPHVKRTPPPEVKERSNRGNQNTKNRRNAAKRSHAQTLADDIRTGKVNKQTHQPIEVEIEPVEIVWMKPASAAKPEGDAE
jgi:hypothetical protein